MSLTFISTASLETSALTRLSVCPCPHLQVLSVIVKTGADLRQEQLATQLIERFVQIWKDEDCECWVR